MHVAKGLTVAIFIVVLAVACAPVAAQTFSLTVVGSGGYVTQSGNGYYSAGAMVTISATPDPGYTFWKWIDVSGNLFSSDRNCTFYMPAHNLALTAVFVQNGVWVNATGNPGVGGSVTGPGVYSVGSSCTLTAVSTPPYGFVRWTSDQAGNNTVSTANPYTFTVTGETTLYAQFQPTPYLLTYSACSGGTASGPTGMIPTGTPVTLNAVPSPGYWFDGWRKDGCDGTVVSRNVSYTFNMPATNYDVHASFAPTELVENFENRATGGSSFDSLDKNDDAGPNQDANGNGNPWWGSVPPNGRVNSGMAHSGSNSLWGTAGDCRDFCNIQARCGGGSPIMGGAYLDWWFYDPLGPTGTTTNFCSDFTALSYYSGVSTDLDYTGQTPSALQNPTQQLAVGMSTDFTIGYDPTRYQVRIVGDPSGYHDGWFNVGVTRSIGWHHARVLLGPRKIMTGTCDVTFFLDDMVVPALPTRDSVTATGFNIIEVNTMTPLAGTAGSLNGAVYSKYFHFSGIDDLSFSFVPVAPASSAPSNISTDSITWNWTSNPPYGDGFRFYNSSSLGDLVGNVPAAAANFTETGLDANVSYTRWIEAYADRYAGAMASARIQLPTVCTLTLPPVYGTSGNGAVRCNNGSGSTTTRYSLSTTTTFIAVNGFGTGPAKVSKYQYFWNTSAGDPASWAGASEWTRSSLSIRPTADGSYYLHLRGCNLDGVANPTALTLGPYIYATATPIAKISDAWPYDDGVLLTLTSKPVTAAYAGNSFWIEESNRSAGMRVAWTGTTGALQDHLVTVTGYLDSTQKPRTLVATAVQDLGAASPKVAPVATVLRDLGGTGFNSKTPSIAGGIGLYNNGLLVRVAGHVTFADSTTDPNNKFFCIDDGSTLAVTNGHPGVKVKCGTYAVPTTGVVSVTGVVSMESTANGYVPILIIRGAGDIVPVP